MNHGRERLFASLRGDSSYALSRSESDLQCMTSADCPTTLYPLVLINHIGVMLLVVFYHPFSMLSLLCSVCIIITVAGCLTCSSRHRPTFRSDNPLVP